MELQQGHERVADADALGGALALLVGHGAPRHRRVLRPKRRRERGGLQAARQLPARREAARGPVSREASGPAVCSTVNSAKHQRKTGQASRDLLTAAQSWHAGHSFCGYM